MLKRAHDVGTHFKSFLEPRQILNKSVESHEHGAFIIEVFFFFQILGAESSLIKSQLQMPVGALMKTA